MKKAMLFIVSFFFAVSAHAATLNLTLDGTGGVWGGATQTISSNNATDVSAYGKGLGLYWYSDFILQSNKDTSAVIDFKAIGAGLAWSSIDIAFGDINTQLFSAGESPFSGVFNFSTTVMLTAGTQYFFLIDGIKNVAGYSLNVSAVPIPAALWLFAPALLGFLGLRRRAQTLAAA